MGVILNMLEKVFQPTKTRSDKTSVWITDFDAVSITRDVLILDSQRTRFILDVNSNFAWAVAPVLSVYSKQRIDLADADKYTDPAEDIQDFIEWHAQVFGLSETSRTIVQFDTSSIYQ